MSDQLLGVGDGQTSDFQLIKSYGAGSEPQQRPITRPRAETLLVSVDGTPVLNWSLGTTGRLTLTSAPSFDVPVRFAEDRIDVSAVNFNSGEAPSIALIELREEL